VSRKGPPLEPRVDPWMERLAWLMDNSIRLGPRWSIGLDGLLGLVPGAGDMASGAISSLIVLRAAASGIPKVTVARMVANVAFDSLLGSIPFAGDLFDFAYKANTKNIEIYRAALAGSRKPRKDYFFLVFLSLILLLLIAIPAFLVVALVRTISGT
jgi:Domain of unknown function (DUF4112)